MTYLTEEWYRKDISKIKIISRENSGTTCNIQYSDLTPDKYFIHRYGGDPMMSGMNIGFKTKAKEISLGRYPKGLAWPYIEVKRSSKNKILEKPKVLKMNLSNDKYVEGSVVTTKVNPNCRSKYHRNNKPYVMKIQMHVVFGHAFYPEFFQDYFNDRHIMHHTGPNYDYRAHKIKPIPYGDNYLSKNTKSRKEEYQSFVRRQGYSIGGIVRPEGPIDIKPSAVSMTEHLEQITKEIYEQYIRRTQSSGDNSGDM